MTAVFQKLVRKGTNFLDRQAPQNSSLRDGQKGFSTAPKERDLFQQVDPSIDGEECLHDCDSCTIRYPSKFKIDEDAKLYGWVKGWSTHLLVATGKSDWTRNCEDEKGSVMEAIDRCDVKTNGRMMLSASNIPVPHEETDPYQQPTRVLLLPAFTWVDNVSPRNVSRLISHVVNAAPTTTTPLVKKVPLQESTQHNGANGTNGVASSDPSTLSIPTDLPFTSQPCQHSALILLCSQKTRDARCGQSAPLLRREFERHLRPLGLYRDLNDERPGGVGIYFISHTGGHKFSANVMIYRRKTIGRGAATNGGGNLISEKSADTYLEGEEDEEQGWGAAQCIWLARVKPDECEGIIKYTVLQGKVVKPDTQLRGGFDRERQLTSW